MVVYSDGWFCTAIGAWQTACTGRVDVLQRCGRVRPAAGWVVPCSSECAAVLGLRRRTGEDGFSQRQQPEELRAPEGRGIPKETPARQPLVPRAIAVMPAHASALRALRVPQVLQDSRRHDLLLVKGRHTERQHLRWQTPVWAKTATDQPVCLSACLPVSILLWFAQGGSLHQG